MKNSKSKTALPIPVKRALQKLGRDVSSARRRRKISIKLMAERAFIGRNTVTRIEKGDPGVSIGIYATVLFVLGMADRLADLADAASDPVGQMLEEEQLRKRVRRNESDYQEMSYGT